VWETNQSQNYSDKKSKKSLMIKEFNYGNRNELILYAKMKLGRLSEEDVAQYKWLLEQWGYDNA
jgi:hypothetical protein